MKLLQLQTSFSAIRSLLSCERMDAIALSADWQDIAASEAEVMSVLRSDG